MVGDDGRGALHDRHPVGVGRRGDQDRAVDEVVDVAALSITQTWPGDDRVADREARDQRRGPCCVIAIGLEDAGVARATAPSPAAPAR